VQYAILFQLSEVTGIPLSGKEIVCQRAAGYADLVPFLHVSDEHGGLLQLARTLAIWFSYCEVDDVRYLADSVMDHLKKNRWSRAHDECICLVDAALTEGLRSCFVVDRIQFLDEFSLSLLRECLHDSNRQRRDSGRRFSGSRHDSRSDSSFGFEAGKICFLCVHVPLYNWKTAADVVEDITRSHRSLRIPVFKLVEAPKEQFRSAFRDIADMEVEERWLDAYTESSGFCAGFFVERIAASRNISGLMWSEGKRGLSEISDELVLSIPPGLFRRNRLFPVTLVGADVAMKYNQVYDELPPLFQTLAKVLAIATRKGLYKLPRFIMWEVLNDLIAEGVDAKVLTIVLEEMTEIFLLKIESEDDEDVLSFRTPALADIALDVCTPIQVRAIGKALLERLDPILSMNFRVPLLMADLHQELGQEEELKKRYWAMSFRAFTNESKKWEKREIDKWKEKIDDEIQAAGYNSADILGTDFFVLCKSRQSVGATLPLLKFILLLWL
jgi:hypothetical protein